MSLIIDGHNLIGVLPHIRLGDPDDELQLLTLLRAYRARAGGPSLIVFFDGSPLPAVDRTRRVSPALRSSPGVQVRFAEPGQNADDAIVAYLMARPQPGQYAVVTNDRELAFRARSAGASVSRAADFAARLEHPGRPAPTAAAGEAGHDPADPAYADISAVFLAAERGCRAFGPRREQVDPAPWIERLYGDDMDQAQQAAHWLGLYGGAAALEPLCDALTHSDVRVRAAALLALGDLGKPAVQAELCERLANDSGSMAREAAAQSLGRIGDRSAIGALERAAAADPKSKVRKAALAALAQIRGRTTK